MPFAEFGDATPGPRSQVWRCTDTRCWRYATKPPADMYFCGFRKSGHRRAADTAPTAMNPRRPNAFQFGRFIGIPDSARIDSLSPQRVAAEPLIIPHPRRNVDGPRESRLASKGVGSTGFEPVTFAMSRRCHSR